MEKLTKKEEKLCQDINTCREIISTTEMDLRVLLVKCHHKIIKEYESAVCIICGKNFGWWCPKSPDHFCHYSESYDSCDFCGEPEERK